MNKDTPIVLNDSNSEIPMTNLYVNDTDCIRKWRKCKGNGARTCKKVKLEPVTEKLNTKFCINSKECFKNHKDNKNNHKTTFNYNNSCSYNYGCFNDIVLLILLLIIFQSFCCMRPMWTM